MAAWIIGGVALGLGLICGRLAPTRQWAKPLITVVTILLFAVMLFGMLIIMWPDFRLRFSYPVQFWGGLGVRHGLLAAGELAAGWTACEGWRKQRMFYLVLAPLFAVGVGAVYARLSAHDYSQLNEAADPAHLTMQSSGYTCTAASLSNVTGLLGAKISEQEAAERMHLDNFGGAVWQVAYVLHELGYSFEEVHDISIEQVKFPALLIVKYGPGVDHAVVVTGRKGQDYTVLDPLNGNVTQPAQWFVERWRDEGVMGIRR